MRSHWTKQSVAVAVSLVGILCGMSANGQTGMAMLKVEPGARPSGMGGAFVAINGDPMSPIYNPAGAVSDIGLTFGTGYCSYWDNISIQTGYLVGRVNPKLFLFGGIRYAGVTDLEYRVNTPSAEPISDFSAHDISFKGGGAYRLTDKFSLGVAAGWFIEKIHVYSGSSFNYDVGLLYEQDQYLTVGASATNMGSDFYLGINGVEESDPVSVPKTYRFGVSYAKDFYLGTIDLVNLDDKSHLHVGGEYKTEEYFTLRAGYMSGYDSKNFTVGGSILVPNYNLTVDYAFIPYTDNLGSTHQFNLTYGL